MAEGLGRLISLILRLSSPMSAVERAKKVATQLVDIGGSRHVGFGDRRIKSLPDAVAKVLNQHFAISADIKTVSNGEQKKVSGSLTDIDQTVVSVSPGQQPLFVNTSKQLCDFDLCPSCGEALLAHEEGCKKCYGCGYSEC